MAGTRPARRAHDPGGPDRRRAPVHRRVPVRRRVPGRRRVLRVLLAAALALLVLAGTFTAGLLAAPIDFTVPAPPAPVVLLAADGRTRIGGIAPTERREPVPAQDLPPVLRDAVIAAEDERFLRHNGVDPLATLRAASRDLAGGHLQGGSTLTQQYVKNVYVSDDHTVLRKVREAALSVRLEQRLSKQQILTDYLNRLYLGNGVYGVEAASQYYFGVRVRDLDLDARRGSREPSLGLARAALLAGIAPAPSQWNPVQDLAAARSRQLYTLNRMVTLAMVSSQEASAAYRRDVTPVRQTPADIPTLAPEFTDLVGARLREQLAGGDSVLFRGGLQVRTTLDVDLQAAVTRAVREVLPDPDDPQAAVVAVDLHNGDVKALTTLRRYPRRVVAPGQVRPAATGYTRNGFDLATSGFRPIGSTLKPFTLAVALQEGHRLDEQRPAPPCGRIPDPGEPSGSYDYCNAADEPAPAGRLTLREALASSVNTVYVPLAIEVGRPRIRQLMLDAGLRTGPPFLTAPNSFGLGATAEASPLSLADAYATLMAGGVHTAPRFLTEIRRGPTGTLVDQEPPEGQGTPVLDPKVAADVVAALGDVVSSGTATAARSDLPVYGKTGTSSDNRDAWFVGCVRAPLDLCLATWMGYEDNLPMRDVHGVAQVDGGSLPARVFARTLQILRDGTAGRGPAAPAG